jgi:D-aminopeptidase
LAVGAHEGTTFVSKPRLRDLGITIGTMPAGALNAITDVPGVRVGHATVVHGEGALRVGEGPARTGVTAIHPHEGSAWEQQVPAAIDILNGAGEITGRSLVDEFGVLGSPILITNTLSVGEVHRATVDWLVRQHPEIGPQHWVAPVVAETYDGFLNDAAGQHVRREHVFAALDEAAGGPVAEGNVGGGTGMTLFGFKGGIGTASRVVRVDGDAWTVGVLVQGNFGARGDLLVDGVPVGLEITDLRNVRGGQQSSGGLGDGSIIVVIGSDAPLSDRQLGRLCRRGMLGLSRVGSTAQHGSGDLLIAFSNAPANRQDVRSRATVLRRAQLSDEWISALFQATIEATSEAVLNALVAAETLTGRDGNTAHALPHDRLREVMRRYGRLREA